VKIYTFFDQIKNNGEYAERKTKLDSVPTIENIEINSDCNLRCTICINPPERGQQIMTLEQVMKITEENHELLDSQHIWLHHFGEPLKHPELEGVIQYLNEKNVNPRFSTNAMLLTDEKSKSIIRAGLKEIVFSIDGTNPDIYNNIRKGADFKTVVNNVLNFLDIKKSMNSKTPETQVQFVNLYGDDDEANKFISYWSATDVNWINIKRPSTRAMKVRDKNIRNYIMENYTDGNKHNKEYPCYWLWSSLIILSDGNVVPCCTDITGENILGNVFNQTLMEIWNSDKLMKMRKDQSAGNYTSSPICEMCPEIRGYSSSFEDKMKYELNQGKNSEKENPGKIIKINHHTLIKNAD